MKKHNKIIHTISNSIINFFLVVLVAFLLLSTISKLKNIPTIIFGKTYIKISSQSMAKSNFNINDIVVIKLTNPNQLQIGDKIAFYYNATSSTPELSEITKQPKGLEYNLFNNFGIGLKTFETVGKKHAIVFHEITDIKIDSNNELWFQTWGTSNYNKDGSKAFDTSWTNQKYIIGSFENKSIFSNIGKTFKNPFYLYLAISSLIILISAFSLLLNLNKYFYIQKLKQRKILISDNRIKPSLFKHLTINEKADILSSIKPNEMLEFKNKAFSYINTKTKK